MPAITGSLSGSAKSQSAITLSDQSNHALTIGEITGTQKSSDQKWNNAALTYWGVTDTVNGKGSQRGYFVNVHTDGDRDWGTFEGNVAPSGAESKVEGSWQFTGGSGKLKGLTGKGTFKIKLSSAGGVEGSWQGAYEIKSAKAQTH